MPLKKAHPDIVFIVKKGVNYYISFQVLHSDLGKLRTQKNELYQENVQLRQNSKSSDKDLPSPDQPTSLQMSLEKKLAETESLYKEERDSNKVIISAC